MKKLSLLSLLLVTSIGRANDNHEEIRLKVQEHLKEVSVCYEKEIKKYPKLKGKLVVEWEIDDKGDVTKAEVNQVETSLTSEAVQNCVIQKLKSWKFPASPAGQAVAVSFPFFFEHK